MSKTDYNEMPEEEFKAHIMAKCLQGMAEIRQARDNAERMRISNRLKDSLWNVLEIVLALVLYRFLFGN